MKLIRLKLGTSFRSLQKGFEFHFLQDGDSYGGIEPYVCAGPNGSGKSNILEALAAIFYHLETCTLRDPPEAFKYDEDTNPDGFRQNSSDPDAFEIEYDIHNVAHDKLTPGLNINIPSRTRIRVTKREGEFIQSHIVSENDEDDDTPLSNGELRSYLPEAVLGYSSGGNEILSLPFFKTRFLHYDEYVEDLRKGNVYGGEPESRLTLLDNEFSQAIFLCNFLLQEPHLLQPLREETEVQDLKQFRIILKKRVELSPEEIERALSSVDQAEELVIEEDEFGAKRYFRSILHHFYQGHSGASSAASIVDRLICCSTSHYHDDAAQTLILDYWVNQATRDAFRQNFSAPLELFQAFQVLFTLNLYTVSEQLKKELYCSYSLYLNETVPTLPSDERIMRFKNLWITKKKTDNWLLSKALSDGEHQLLHTLGLALLYREKNCLFLLDEPETHFNPNWRSRFITSLKKCMTSQNQAQSEILITTHSPFLISDSKRKNVLVFSKKDGEIEIIEPNYNTFGASINRITMETFHKRETIGGQAEIALSDFRRRYDAGEKSDEFIEEIEATLGDSVEKILFIKTILTNRPPKGKRRRRINLD